MNELLEKEYEETNMKIAKRIKQLRKNKRMSQTMLAEKSGVSFGTIKRFEKKGEISLSSLIKLASVLKCEKELENLFIDYL